MSLKITLSGTDKPSNAIRLILAYLDASELKKKIDVQVANVPSPVFEENGTVHNEFGKIALRLSELFTPALGSLVGDDAAKKSIIGWIDYAQNQFEPAIVSQQVKLVRPTLAKLGKQIEPIVYLVNNRLSLADLTLFSYLSPVLKSWSEDDIQSNESIARWYDNIQHQKPIRQVVLDQQLFVLINKHNKLDVSQSTQPTEIKNQAPPKIEPVPHHYEPEVVAPKAEPAPKAGGKKKPEPAPKTEGKKKNQPAPKEKEPEPSDENAGFAKLDMRVGRIIQIQKHPNADTLYQEEIDVGEDKPRVVVSGLVKFVPIEELHNRLVIVLCNIKPSAMRGVKSEAMLICASNEDHSAVEIIDPPSDSKPGDRIRVDGEEGSSEEIINLGNKKNVFHTVIQKDLRTNADGFAVYKNKQLLSSNGALKAKSITHGYLS